MERKWLDIYIHREREREREKEKERERENEKEKERKMCVCVSVPGVYKRERDICDCMDKGKQERECMERKWLDTFCKISKQ